jgi:hypothetical protein
VLQGPELEVTEPSEEPILPLGGDFTSPPMSPIAALANVETFVFLVATFNKRREIPHGVRDDGSGNRMATRVGTGRGRRFVPSTSQVSRLRLGPRQQAPRHSQEVAVLLKRGHAGRRLADGIFPSD